MMHIQPGLDFTRVWHAQVGGEPKELDYYILSTSIKDIFEEFLRQTNTLTAIPKNACILPPR